MATTELRLLRRERELITARLAVAENGMLDWIRRHPEFEVGALADAVGLSQQAANNHCRQLWKLELLERERIVPEGGGKQFLYRATEELLRRPKEPHA
jgi:predicted transcriptional regulator